MRDCRKEGRADKSKTDKLLDEASAAVVDQMQERQLSMRTKLKQRAHLLLQYQDIPVIKTTQQWNELTRDMDKMGNPVRRAIQLQIRLLVNRYGLKRKDLMTFSSKETGPFANDVVVERYLTDVLGKIISGDLKLIHQPLSRTLMKEVHVFRGGQKYEGSLDTGPSYIDAIIKEVKEERAKSVAVAATKPCSRGRKRRRHEPRKKLLGRRVLSDGIRWNLPADDLFVGVIMKKTRYVEFHTKKERDGYEVRWVLDGVCECLPYEDLLPMCEYYDEWEGGEEDNVEVEREIVEVDGENKKEMVVVNDLVDNERESMRCGEGEAYHSDDDLFVIGGDGDKINVIDR